MTFAYMVFLFTTELISAVGTVADSNADIITRFSGPPLWTEDERLSRNPQGIWYQIETAEAPSLVG